MNMILIPLPLVGDTDDNKDSPHITLAALLLTMLLKLPAASAACFPISWPMMPKSRWWTTLLSTEY